MTKTTIFKILLIILLILAIGITLFGIVQCSQHKQNGTIEDTFPTTPTPESLPITITYHTPEPIDETEQTTIEPTEEISTAIPTELISNIKNTSVPTIIPTTIPVITNTPKPIIEPTANPTVIPTNTPEPTVIPNQYPIQYSDDTATITIYKEWYGKAWCYEAHLQFTDYNRFYSECANGKFNNGLETTSQCAKRINALLCVNGDYSAPSLGYPVVRKGIVWIDKAYYAPGSYNSYNGKLFWTYEGSPTSGQQLSTLVENHKVTDFFIFGPDFLRNGNIVNVTPGGNRRPRTFMGTNGNSGDIWIIVADGDHNDGKSSGLTGYECAKLLKDKGCIFGIPLDGGGSSTMVWKGKVLNAVKGHERAIVDFIIFK